MAGNTNASRMLRPRDVRLSGEALYVELLAPGTRVWADDAFFLLEVRLNPLTQGVPS